MEKVYRHELYPRITHGIHAIAMIMLILTGFQIHWPNQVRLFDTISMARYVHFIFAWLIIWCYVARGYFYFGYTRHGMEFIFRPSDVPEFFKLIKYYLFGMFVHAPKPKFGRYNPGQRLAYSIWPILLVPQVLTGFALYEPELLSWFVDIFSGLGYVRFWHFILTIFYSISLMAHIYLGTTGVTLFDHYLSMITGYESSSE